MQPIECVTKVQEHLIYSTMTAASSYTECSYMLKEPVHDRIIHRREKTSGAEIGEVQYSVGEDIDRPRFIPDFTTFSEEELFQYSTVHDHGISLEHIIRIQKYMNSTAKQFLLEARKQYRTIYNTVQVP